MYVGKIEILVPVKLGHVVLARADVIADAAVDGLVDLGPLLGRQAFGTQETIDRVGTDAGQELAVGVGPLVILGTGHVKSSRGDGRQELMLIDRQVILAFVVIAESRGEPMRETRVDISQTFTDPAKRTEYGKESIPFDPQNTNFNLLQYAESERQGSYFYTGGLVAAHPTT